MHRALVAARGAEGRLAPAQRSHGNPRQCASCRVNIGEVEVRDATPEDAFALAWVHAETWVDTYVGRVPEEIATERVGRARNRDWREHAELRRRLGGGVLVLGTKDAVVGFCEFGPTEDPGENPSQVGHIMRLYVLPAHQGRGGGRLLLDAACHRLSGGGFESVTLWTVEDEWNPAHDFYRRLGWVREGARQTEGDIRYRLEFP